MGQYTPRYEFVEVKEVGVDGFNSQYSLHIDVVEVIDQDGRPWEPVPGPDPWDDLVVATKATWSNGNVYAVGSTISGVSATFTGGTDQVVYRSRTQHRPYGSDSWINSPWTNHTNTPQVIGFTIPAGEEGGEVRFQTQARDNGVDPVDQVNSFASIQTIAGPVMTPVVTKLNGAVVDTNEALEVSAGTHTLQIIANAIPPDIQYQWSLRTGTGTLTKDPNDPSKATYTTGNGDVAPLVATTLDSNISENTSVSWQLFVL